MWIIKPGEATNRGHGITVVERLDEIEQVIESGELHENGHKITYIVQKYIANPLLYRKRKFDIRCFMLVTCSGGIMKGYWYPDGYIRTSSKEFTVRNFDKMIHLTNDAIQKNAEDYGKFEAGNKVSYVEFQRYVDQCENKFNFMQEIYPQMKVTLVSADSLEESIGLHQGSLWATQRLE